MVAGGVEAVQTQEEDASQSSSDDSDEDAGLSAAKVLAKRHFKPRALGGGIALEKTPAVRRFQAQQRVLARFQGGEHWFPGTIVEVRRGNEYHVQYDDGELEYHVPAALIQDAAEAKHEKAVHDERDDLHPRSDQDNDADADSAADDSPRDRSSSDADAVDDDDGWQAQEDGLHARWGGTKNRMKYVPPPPQQ
ncbi:hypothetical protein PINS_up011067 [Pythium insidiosum]|nr:hypothetical protein PINS_up011067 [Pythium insidiosum]